MYSEIKALDGTIITISLVQFLIRCLNKYDFPMLVGAEKEKIRFVCM